jgi:hypothetical protein
MEGSFRRRGDRIVRINGERRNDTPAGELFLKGVIPSAACSRLARCFEKRAVLSPKSALSIITALMPCSTRRVYGLDFFNFLLLFYSYSTQYYSTLKGDCIDFAFIFKIKNRAI